MNLDPYLMFSGNAEEALNFYKECLSGEIKGIQRYGEAPMPSSEDQKDKIMHASLAFEGNTIMISDSHTDYPVTFGDNIHLSLDVADTEKLNIIFEKLSAGGAVTMPIQDTFWGARFGMLKDKFGIHWMLNCELKK